MYVAFAIAAIVGVAVFAIWWFTSPRAPGTQQQVAESATPSSDGAAPAPKPSPEAVIELNLPRGGTLTGWSDNRDLAVDRLLGAPLIRINRATDRPEPWLAESWTASPDNLIYTVKLRPGLKWSDGRAFTAEEAAGALAAVQTFGKPVAFRASDPQTLEVTFPQAFAPGLRVLDGHMIEGLGPFIEPKPGTFVRNPHYFRKAGDGAALPYIDEVVLAPRRPDNADFVDAVVSADEMEAARKLEQSGKARLFDLGPGLDVDALWINPRESPDRPWLAHESLRLAISAAADRREYCKQVFFGACDPVVGPVSPANVNWFNPDLPMGRRDPGLARAMLEELGLRDRTGDGILNDATRKAVRFTLAIRNDVPSAARAAAFIVNTLKGIGVRVDVTPMSATALAARRAKGTYDAIYDRIVMRDTDPAMNLDFWMSNGVAHPWNGSSARQPFDWERQIDDLMMKNATTFDRVERLQAFVDAQKLYVQHMPAVFFGVPYVRITTSMSVLNATPSIFKPHLLWSADTMARLR